MTTSSIAVTVKSKPTSIGVLSDSMNDVLGLVSNLLQRKDPKAAFLARQWLFLNNPLSKIVEMYLYDNEGKPQRLEKFQMMSHIYDNLPQRLLLKCSRKTLKSTLLSNLITLNMIRYNHYHMLYVAPQEISTKYFSNNYLNVRFESPPLKKILNGFEKNDVFEKILNVTKSSIILRYCKDDATRIRGPATDHNIHDEIQDILFDVLPIIKETMALSPFKREFFAGTPLTTDNTINALWKTSNQLEWAMKCEACNHWNTLTEDNEPMKMIRKEGLSCSKCSALIDSSKGMWVEFNPKNPEDRDLVGFHLAQPILTHFNSDPKEWKEIYKKSTNERYSLGQIYNEVFGLAYDVGTKPITEEFLRNQCCVLGPMNDDPATGATSAYERRRLNYHIFTCGADWGVNMDTSRTACCIGALRDDGVFEVFYLKIYKNFDYDWQIRDIADRANAVGAFCAADSGPDPMRGIRLMHLTSTRRTQLVRYEAGKFKQEYKLPKGAIDPTQGRWCLHRSDTMSFTFDLLKKGKILFPRWEDSEECMRDILNIFIEVKEGNLRQELHYRHGADKPDDFFHALNFAVCQAHVAANNPVLFAPSTTSEDVVASDS